MCTFLDAVLLATLFHLRAQMGTLSRHWLSRILLSSILFAAAASSALHGFPKAEMHNIHCKMGKILLRAIFHTAASDFCSLNCSFAKSRLLWLPSRATSTTSPSSADAVILSFCPWKAKRNDFQNFVESLSVSYCHTLIFSRFCRLQMYFSALLTPLCTSSL